MSVTLVDLKTNLYIDGSDHDLKLSMALHGAISFVEKSIGQTLSVTEKNKWFKSFGDRLHIDGPAPHETVIEYLDVNGQQQIFDRNNYYVVESELRPYLQRLDHIKWPITAKHDQAVKVSYRSGFSESSLPSDIRSSVLLIAGHLFENNEQVTDIKMYNIPMGAYALLERHTVVRL